MERNSGHPSVRRIILPSGRSIEVVRFPDVERQPPQDLWVCARCESELVQPVEWGDASDDRWQLTLECPNCGLTTTGAYDRDQVDELEEKLDDGLAQIMSDLQRLTQANMAEETERFATALGTDLILPEDF